jgi:hypothetical protein
LVYKGKFSYAPRERTICDLADGTSAFADELPEGAEVTRRRTVTVRDGEILGVWKRSARALILLASALFPEFGPVRPRRRGRKDPPVAATPFDIDPKLELIRLCNNLALETNPASPAVLSNPGDRSATSNPPARAPGVAFRKE